MECTHPLGHMLRIAREKRGYTLKELAKLSGYGESYLSRIENGRVQPVNLQLLNRLATALSLSPLEAHEMVGAAYDSQKIIRIPSGVSIRGYKAVHNFMRAFIAGGDDGLGRIETFLLEELGRYSGTQHGS